MDDNLKNTFDVIFTFIQTVVILAGAIWAYIRFFREGTHRPRIEFDVDCSFLGPQNGRYVAGFLVHAHNHGNIEYRFDEIRLRVRAIETDADLREWQEGSPLLEFPKREYPTVNIIPEDYKYYWVPPGVHERFSFVISVPAGWRFIIVRATFKYHSSKEIHAAERVFEVKAQETG